MTSTDDLVRKAQAARDALKGLYFSAEEGSPLEAGALAGAEAITGLLKRMPVTPTTAGDREALAAHLSVEEFEDGFTWPEHAEDDGYRGGGYVQIAPSDIQALRREAADRILILLQQRGFARPWSTTPDGVIKERGEDGRRPDGPGLSHSVSSPMGSPAAAASIPGAGCWPVKVGEETTLADCETGLFISEYGSLCLKSEYGNNEGRIDAYIVDSGEFFWGDPPQTITSQRASRVRPVEIEVPAPGIETGTATTEGRGPKDESPVGKAEAPASLVLPPSSQESGVGETHDATSGGEALGLSEAVTAYLAARDAAPEKDCWDTESGEEEPGAQKFSSDWAWQDHHNRVATALANLRAAAPRPSQREG